MSQNIKSEIQEKPISVQKWLVLLIMTIVMVVLLVSPFQAFSWIKRPFPGFVVEQTLVISDINGKAWEGRLQGLGFPQRLTSLNETDLTNPTEFDAALRRLSQDQSISLRTTYPDGSIRVYPSITLRTLASRDITRLFWLPYFVGLAFFILGIWVYRIRGQTRPGQAFAYFCAWATLSIILLFDLVSTHFWTALWFLAITQQGGSLISLAFVFPQEWSAIKSKPWLKFIPITVSIFLAAWGIGFLYDTSNPWAYVDVWRYSYYYIASGITIFFAVMLYQFKTSKSPLVQLQVRVILWGSLLAFLPIAMWFITPLFGLNVEWNPGIFLPFLFLFPFSIGIAILRYRLWDIDVLINRTIVYGLLTLLLGSIYFASIVALQQLFINLTGQRSPFAVAVSTLGIAILFNPLRQRIQVFIDRRFFRNKYNTARTLETFGASLRHQVDLDNLKDELISIVTETMQPTQAILCNCLDPSVSSQSTLTMDDPLRKHLISSNEVVEINKLNLPSMALQTFREDGIVLFVPLISQGDLVGLLNLGPRRSEQTYSKDDRQLLKMLASQAAPALRVAQMVQQQKSEALERQRIEHELRIAAIIQQALLPKEPPHLPGWQVEAHYQPARAVGGDFYDYIYFEDGRLGFVIGDVTDKGIPAALVMANVRSLIRSVAMQLVSPHLVLQKVNDLLITDIPKNMFVTCLYALLDPESGRFEFANAGHNLPYLRNNLTISELWAKGMPLGLMPGMNYEECEAILSPDDCLLLYSDGIVEAHDQQYEMFGNPRLKSILTTWLNQTSLIDTLLEELDAFTGEGWDQEDDVTLVTIQRIGITTPGADGEITFSKNLVQV